jgi:RND superfamily putative drug exporter
VAQTNERMVDEVQADIDSTVEIHTSGRVRSHISGTPTLDRAIEDEALATTRVATLVALPVLFLALLVILRAPLAALATTVFGGVVAFSGFGVMTLVAEIFEVDAIGIALTSLMGLALGTGLALMIVTRFRREEAALTGNPREAAVAASASIRGTGRAVLIAGTGLFIALFVASLIGPTENLHSVGTGATVNALLATGAAVVVMPALLTLAGKALFAGSFGAPRVLSTPWNRLVGAERFVLRRAVVFGGAATLALIALAIPALNIETGPVDPSFLPADNKARQDLERIQQAMGPGFPFAYNIVVVSDSGPLTEKKMLRALDRFQVQIANDKRVASVAGPGEFAPPTLARSRSSSTIPRSCSAVPARTWPSWRAAWARRVPGRCSSRTACVRPRPGPAKSPAAVATPPTARNVSAPVSRTLERARSRSRADSARRSTAPTS